MFTSVTWLFEFIYYRPYFYTDYLSLSKFFTWMFLLVVGFTFVNVSNLNGERSNVFMSRDGSYKDIKGLLKLGVVLFFIAPIIFLRGKYDLEEYCSVPTENIMNPPSDTSSILSIIEKILSEYIFVPPTEPSCQHYNKHQLWSWNYYYLFWFIIGCNFTHFD